MNRRRFLAGGAAGVGLLAGCTRAEVEQARQAIGKSQGQTQEDGDSEGSSEPEPTENDSQAQRVVIGPDGQLGYEPEMLRIEPGTTVEFVWDSGGHNLVPVAQPEDASWEGVEDLHSAGFTYQHTFEVPGTYEFVCEPHEVAIPNGVIEVAVDEEGAATESTESTESTGPVSEEQTVEVGPGGVLGFAPQEARIVPGGTVEWVWKSGGHNIVPESGDWGVPQLKEEGFTYTHTFEETGVYEYYCEPHRSAGAVGVVEVVEEDQDD